MHRELARGVDGEQPGGMHHRRVHGKTAQFVGVGERVVEAGPSAVDPQAAFEREPDQHRDAQALALGQPEIAETQGHGDLHGHPVGVPDRVVPGCVRRGQRGLDHLGPAASWARSRSSAARAWSTRPARLAWAASRAASPCPPILLRGSDRTLSSSCSMRESAKSTALRYAAVVRARSSNMPHTWL